MTAGLKLMEWFRDEPLPPLVDDPCVVVGGTRLLSEFLAVPALHAEGRLVMASAFVESGIVAAAAQWNAMPHRQIDLSLLTSSREDAEAAAREVGEFPWRSISINWLRGLHAKMYTFRTTSGCGACLVGSHNLTLGGARLNTECGVLFTANNQPTLASFIEGCEARTLQLISSAQLWTGSSRRSARAPRR